MMTPKVNSKALYYIFEPFGKSGNEIYFDKVTKNLENISKNCLGNPCGFEEIIQTLQELKKSILGLTDTFDFYHYLDGPGMYPSKTVYEVLMYYLFFINTYVELNSYFMIEAYSKHLITYLVRLLYVFCGRKNYTEQIFSELEEVLRQKNHDYTNGAKEDALINFKRASILGVSPAKGLLIRLVDKIGRVETYICKGNLEVKDETFYSAVSDITGYLILLLTMLKKPNTHKNAP